MKCSEKEEKELYEWGITFFELGWSSAFKFISQSGQWAKKQKAEAVRSFIKKQLKKSD